VINRARSEVTTPHTAGDHGFDRQVAPVAPKILQHRISTTLIAADPDGRASRQMAVDRSSVHVKTQPRVSAL
jgi:hypothetical protein